MISNKTTVAKNNQQQSWAPLIILFISFIFTTNALADSMTQKDHGVVKIPYPEIDYGTGEHAELLKRGEYLTKAGDCIACHTDTRNDGPAFAGGLGVDTPFGKLYSTNITADAETGIGEWTDKQFVRAMRKGKGPGGKHYFPVFPFTSFTKVTDEDLLAIKAYLFAIPKVHKPETPNEMRFPFNIRFLQIGWKILFFRSGYFQPDPDVPEKINRGGYLVEGLGHCAECHSPRNIFGAVKKKYALTGGFIDGFYAPDITTYGIGDSPIEEVVRVFTEGRKLRNRGYVEGPMKDVDHNSLEYLENHDLEAISEYLKRYEAKMYHKVSERIATDITTAEAKKIYTSHCAVCHDTGAANAPKLSDQEAWQTRLDNQGMDHIVQNAIQGLNSMPAKGACMKCSDGEVEATVKYMVAVSLDTGVKKKRRRAPASAKPRKLTMADGKKVYEIHCAVCHAEGQVNSPKVGDKAAWAKRLNKNMDILFHNTIQGFKGHPARGACVDCKNQDLIAAVKYMVDESSDNVDVGLW